MFSSQSQEVLATLKKPNSVKEWNELMASMLYHNSQQEVDKIKGSEKQLSSDLVALMKLRNRRIRRKQPIGPLKNWPTANAELYLKC